MSQIALSCDTPAERRLKAVRLRSARALREAQALRYRVFSSEFDAQLKGADQGLDMEDYDRHCAHIGVRDLNTGEETRQEVGGLFLLLGADPGCGWLPDDICRDERGFVLTGRDIPKHLWRGGTPPANLETAVPGIFAAGDVRGGSMKRVAAASGEGASVVPLVHAFLGAGG